GFSSDFTKLFQAPASQVFRPSPASFFPTQRNVRPTVARLRRQQELFRAIRDRAFQARGNSYFGLSKRSPRTAGYARYPPRLPISSSVLNCWNLPKTAQKGA